jgi:hypothetical protein
MSPPAIREAAMPHLNEHVLIWIIVAGLVVLAAGYLWLIVRAFQTALGWGLAALLLPPVGGLVYAAAHFRRALGPLLVMLAGLLVAGGAVAYNRLVPPPKEAVTEDKDGEKRGTLTGATESDLVEYLKANRDLAVLQMAGRKELTDEVLAEHVRGMPNLRELDVNDTPITDKGLEVLASLPKLEAVRIARTKATPEGVQKHVLSLKGVKNIAVGGLGVPTKVLREWRNADPENRRYDN